MYYWEEKIKPSIVIFGDSHGLSFLPTVDSAMSQLNESAYFIATHACIPFLKIHSFHNDQSSRKCNKLNKRVFNFIKQKKIKNIILVARWTYYTDGGYDGNDFSYIAIKSKSEKNKDISVMLLKLDLEKQ